MSTSPMGRLTFRVEGKSWNCYYSIYDTMEGGIFLGSIPMALVINPERKSQFMELMRECFSDVMEEASGVRPTWPDPEGYEAPPHERSGNA